MTSSPSVLISCLLSPDLFSIDAIVDSLHSPPLLTLLPSLPLQGLLCRLPVLAHFQHLLPLLMLSCCGTGSCDQTAFLHYKSIRPLFSSTIFPAKSLYFSNLMESHSCNSSCLFATCDSLLNPSLLLPPLLSLHRGYYQYLFYKTDKI